MRRRTILLVEDEPMLRHILSEGLEEEGFTVKAAADADAAWIMICDGLAFDILVTDVRMPGDMDGLDLARCVVRRHPSTQIIVMSGFTAQASFDQRLGKFLGKPFTSRQLASTISSSTS